MVQEVNEEIPCSLSSKDKKPHDANRICRWLRGKNGSTKKRKRTSVLWANQAHTLEAAIDQLVPAVIRQNPYYVYIFLDAYRTYASTQQVLDILFARYGCIDSTYAEVGGPQEQQNTAVYVFLSMWLEKYPGDFVQPPESPSLHALLAYLQVNVPGSDLERRARLLLSEGQHVEATEAEAGATAPAPQQGQEVPQLVPAATLATAATLGPELAPAIPAAAAHHGSGRAGTPPAPLGPGQVVVRAIVHYSQMEEPSGPVPDLEDQQCSAPAPGVPEEPQPAPASVEPPGSAPEQQLVLAAAPEHVFPPPVISFFFIFVLFIRLYNYFIDLIYK